ncbi:MAG: DUF2723 domain-containing protein [Ignavibacteria bacterium]|nr:DUF2723 domain-containing protein [Ignavibacteria bacterium]
MQNTNRNLHYALAAIVFIVAMATYLMTVQPTVPFWDCGEFTAAAVQQQVPHPPGAPLFLMIGKVFHLLPFGDPGWRINLVSVISSAVTILLLYLITVKVIRNFFQEDLSEVGNALLVYGSAAVAALTYTFTDTFWFNAVESEVYAASSLFVALITWIMMVWNEKADEVGHERWLLLIAYLIGVSIGVHLLSVLTVFSLTLLVYLRRYKYSTKGLIWTMLLGIGIFVVVYNLVILKLPALFAGNLPFKNAAGEFLVEDNFLFTLIGIGLIAGCAYLVYYGRKTNHGVIALTSSAILLLMIGYSSYAHILIRANSNPPMNENKPDDLDKLVSYLGREQYGEAPNWPRRYQTEDRFTRNYTKYGKWERPPLKVVEFKDGGRGQRPDYGAWKTNVGAELGYLWGYQIDHMYLRYFLWNFMGRQSDIQDSEAYSPLTSAKAVEALNHKSGYADKFPVNLFAIPLILGLIGMYFHFMRDRKMAWVYLVLFAMTGVLAAIQQNQQNPQPRERDYFYVSSFMVFAMWVGLGVFAILERFKKNPALVGGGLAVAILIAPFNMMRQEWGIHSRAGNYLAFDYAYNILQSVEPNAIVFTNGDNDTFPVWYLQDVAGVRRDVRIVNLSLGQTLWYVEQLKNRSPFGVQKVPLSFTDEQLSVSEDNVKALTYDFGPAQPVSISVSPKILAQYTNDQNIINSGVMQFTYHGAKRGQGQNGDVEYFNGVQHKLVLDILKQTKFERPVYFSTSVGDPAWADEYIGLDNFLRLEGMTFRVCPAPQRSAIGEGVNDKVMYKSLMESRDGDDYSTGQAYGLKFRNLNNPAVYYDDVNRGYVLNYRNIFYKYTTYLLYELRDSSRAAKVLARMNEKLSLDQFPIGMNFELQLGQLFESCGDQKNAEVMAQRALKSAQQIIGNPSLRNAEPQMNENVIPERIAADASAMLGKWTEAINYYKVFASGGEADVYVNYYIDEIEIMKKERRRDYVGALAIAESLQPKYPLTTPDKSTQQVAGELQRKIMELRNRLGAHPDPVITMTP